MFDLKCSLMLGARPLKNKLKDFFYKKLDYSLFSLSKAEQQFAVPICFINPISVHSLNDTPEKECLGSHSHCSFLSFVRF